MQGGALALLTEYNTPTTHVPYKVHTSKTTTLWKPIWTLIKSYVLVTLSARTALGEGKGVFISGVSV